MSYFLQRTIIQQVLSKEKPLSFQKIDNSKLEVIMELSKKYILCFHSTWFLSSLFFPLTLACSTLHDGHKHLLVLYVMWLSLSMYLHKSSWKCENSFQYFVTHLNERLMTFNIKIHANGYNQYYCLHQIMIQIQQNLGNDTESRTLPLWLIDQEKLDD